MRPRRRGDPIIAACHAVTYLVTMSRVSRNDWALGQLLFDQGVKYDEVAKRLGTTAAAVRQRSHRYAWTATREKALRETAQIVTGKSALTLVEKSRLVRSTLADELSESANALRQTPIAPQLAHLGERADVSTKLATASAKVFSWADNQIIGLVDAGAMRLADALEREEALPVPAIEDAR